METFASYILDPKKDVEEKLVIMCYLEKKLRDDPKKRIFFDKSVIFKTALTKMFVEVMNINDVDRNVLYTATLLCNCKKGIDPQKVGKVHSYAKEGAEFLATLGFDDRFCRICEQVNRYSQSTPRESEGDILELIDNFGGMMLDRPERRGYSPMDAYIQIERANLRGLENKYLSIFKKFIEKLETVDIVLPETNMEVNGLRAFARKINS